MTPRSNNPAKKRCADSRKIQSLTSPGPGAKNSWALFALFVFVLVRRLQVLGVIAIGESNIAECLYNKVKFRCIFLQSIFNLCPIGIIDALQLVQEQVQNILKLRRLFFMFETGSRT